jgi:hypothetical protein
MKLNDHLQNLSFDTRLVEWNLKHKIIKQESFDKHLDALPDSDGKFTYTKIEDLRNERGS